MCFLQKRLGREAKGFVGGQDPDFDDFCLAALFGVGYIRHRGKGTNLCGDSKAPGAFRGLVMPYLVAFHNARVLLSTPPSDTTLQCVPKLRSSKSLCAPTTTVRP